MTRDTQSIKKKSVPKLLFGHVQILETMFVYYSKDIWNQNQYHRTTQSS